MAYRSLLKLLLLAAFIGGAIWLFNFTDAGRQVTVASVRDFIDSFHPATARLLYVAVYIVGTVLLLPGTLLSFVGAALFGVIEGTLYTWIGATIGATLAFLLSRWLGRDFVNQMLGGRLQRLDERLSRHGFLGLLLLRMVPIFPFNGLNFGCGLTGIRLRDYVLATAIGILPGTFVYQFLFAPLSEKLLGEGLSLEDLWDVRLLVGVAVFVGFTILGRWLSKKLQPGTEPGR